MASRKPMIIINSIAGNGCASDLWPHIVSTLHKGGYDFDFEFTSHKYHAVTLTIEAIKAGVREFVAIGGDGTLHEVINGIFFQKDVPTEEITVGVIPIGNGNDSCRCIDISSELDMALEFLLFHRTELLDVGKVSFMDMGVKRERYFANVAGGAFEADIVRQYEKLSEAGKKKTDSTYFNLALRTFLFCKHKKMSVKIDGKHFYSGNVFLLSVGIGKYIGHCMQILPYAIVDDGLLDITLIRGINKFSIIRHMFEFINGQVYTVSSAAMHGRGRVIDVEPLEKNAGYLETDGEFMGVPPFHFEILPQSVNVIVGKRFGATPKN